MDRIRLSEKVEINLVNYSQTKLESRLSEHGLYITLKKTPIRIYVVCKYFSAEQIERDPELIQIALYLEQEPEECGYTAFSVRQLKELADYCRFQTLATLNESSAYFAKTSVLIAEAQRLEYLNICGVGRRLVHAQHAYASFVADFRKSLESIDRQHEELMETHSDMMKILEAQKQFVSKM